MFREQIKMPANGQSLFQKFCLHHKESKNPVVIFGAGDQGLGQRKYLSSLGIPVAAFCDNDPQKQGATLKDIPVLSLEEVAAWNCSVDILLNDSYYAEKQTQIAALDNPSLVPWRFDLFSPVFKGFDHAYVEEHLDEFERSYQLLEDDCSRKVFCAILNAVCTGDLSYYDAIQSDGEYFPKDILPMRDDHSYVDVGAFDGNTCQAFADCFHGRYRKIYAFEPVPSSAERVLKRGLPRLELYPVAASDQEGSFPFRYNDYCDTPMATTVEFPSGTGPIHTLKTDTIDHVLDGQEATFIKMDIEGSELAALKGAAQTIRTDKPFLAICVYHKREDLITIPQYLKELVPEYKLYLRHHSLTPVDTVLYCRL